MIYSSKKAKELHNVVYYDQDFALICSFAFKGTCHKKTFLRRSIRLKKTSGDRTMVGCMLFGWAW